MQLIEIEQSKQKIRMNRIYNVGAAAVSGLVNSLSSIERRFSFSRSICL